MKRIAGYEIIEQIAETRKSRVFRVKETQSEQTFVIKSLKERQPSVLDLLHFKKEYALIKEIKLPGIIRILDLFEVEGQWFLLLEDFWGISLKEYIRQQPVSLQAFLKIGYSLAQTLGYLHQMDLIHKDIKPHNILINPQDFSVKITDFGIATLLPLGDDSLKAIQEINGTLSYMSPEQTGRMNCSLDYRSDFYSLGITFYETLCGELPFKFKDPLELIYAHIALSPKKLKSCEREIPEVVKSIVHKLMEKNPEERYQNAFALAHDLKICLDTYNVKGKVETFSIAQKDISMRFNMPQILVGRELEIEKLLSDFWAVCQGKTRFVFLEGVPGSGKSTLVRSLQKDVLVSKGLFIEARFELSAGEMSTGGLSEALGKMLRYLLTQPEIVVDKWKAELKEHIEPFLPLLSEILPQIKWFFPINSHKALPDISAEEKKRNLFQSFYQIMKLFATREHPLVVFLDDMQWMDDVGRDFLAYLAGQPPLKYFLFIGTIRSTTESWYLYLKNLLADAFPLNELKILALNQDSVSAILSRMFSLQGDSLQALAELVFQKTNGNPFFMQQFLKTLFNQGKIWLDIQSGWQWDREGVEHFEVTANVAGLLQSKMEELEPDTLKILTIAAVIGFRFKLEQLSEAAALELADALEQVSLLIKLGYLHREREWYFFEHDHIKDAAYEKLSASQKEQLHFQIGSSLWAKQTPSMDTEVFLGMVEHLNRGVSCFKDDSEAKLMLGRLNLEAGQKVMLSNNYHPALNFSIQGLNLVQGHSWEEHFALMFGLFSLRVQCEFLSGNFNKGEAFFQEALVHLKKGVDQVKLYQIRFESYWHLTKVEGAISGALEGLKLLGINLSVNPTQFQIRSQLRKTRRLLGKISGEKILRSPEIQEEELLLILKFLTELTIAATYINPKLAVLINLTQINLEVKKGTSGYSSAMYAFYSSILGSYGGDYEGGYAYGRLALELAARFNYPESTTKTYLTMATSIIHWKDHLRQSMGLFKKAYQTGHQNGIYYYAARALNTMAAYRIMLGDNLVEIFDDYRSYQTFAQETGEGYIRRYFQDNLDMLRALMGQMGSGEQGIEGTSAQKRESQLEREGNLTEYFYYYFIQLRLNFLKGQHRKNLSLLDKLDPILPIVQVFHIPEYHFYQGLTYCALYHQVTSQEQRIFKKKLRKNIERLEDWARLCPENFLHKWLLLQAEWARLQNNSEKAEQKYKEAIDSAKEAGFLQNQGIAAELAGKFYIGRGFSQIAQIYFQEAYQCFFRWGAYSKTKCLEDSYPHLLTHKFILSVKSRKWGGKEGTTSSATTFEAVDLRAVMKVSQVVLRKLELEELLKSILHFALENAGATQGALLIPQSGNEDVYLAVSSQGEDVFVLPVGPLAKVPHVAVNVVEYVRKTGETLLLDHALESELFQLDEHIQEQKVKSLLCIPISYKEKISGFLYLENNIAPQAFTRDRMELLYVLTSQAAISIENAQLIKQREEAASLKKELEIAASLQTALLPHQPEVPGFDLAAFMSPAEVVGGDYYDVIADREKSWVLIGDVAGHGLSSGLIMMMVQTAVRALLKKEEYHSPAILLQALNQAVRDNIKKISYGKYLTLLALAVYPDGRIVYSGLHQNFLVYKAATKMVEPIRSKGRWIGVDEDVYSDKVQFVDQEITIAPEDVVLLYTDGIVEARDGAAKMLGQKGLESFLLRQGGGTPLEMKEGLGKKMHHFHTIDDLTFLILKKKNSIVL